RAREAASALSCRPVEPARSLRSPAVRGYRGVTRGRVEGQGLVVAVHQPAAKIGPRRLLVAGRATGRKTPPQGAVKVGVGGPVLLAEGLRAGQLALVEPLEVALLHGVLGEVEVDAERQLARRLRQDEEGEDLVRLEAQE